MEPRHCPFLNRDDDRCASSFSMGSLEHLFQRCFRNFATCPAYQEMLAERQESRAKAKAARSYVQLTVDGRAARQEMPAERVVGRPYEGRPVHAAA
ncbi:MAG: hypothetical protein ACFCVE_01990 [Phycisphaerae bacterium]